MMSSAGEDPRNAHWLLGSLAAENGELTSTMQLGDGRTNQILWMDRARMALFTASAELEKMANNVAGLAARAIQQSVTARAHSKPIDDLPPLECVLRASPSMFWLTRASLDEALELLNRALQLESNHALAYA
jgi:hypothetical protein